MDAATNPRFGPQFEDRFALERRATTAGSVAAVLSMAVRLLQLFAQGIDKLVSVFSVHHLDSAMADSKYAEDLEVLLASCVARSKSVDLLVWAARDRDEHFNHLYELLNGVVQQRAENRQPAPRVTIWRVIDSWPAEMRPFVLGSSHDLGAAMIQVRVQDKYVASAVSDSSNSDDFKRLESLFQRLQQKCNDRISGLDHSHYLQVRNLDYSAVMPTPEIKVVWGLRLPVTPPTFSMGQGDPGR